MTAAPGATRSDVLVVGAGIVGCATAWHLARRGASVRVLERGTIAGEQSSRAWGFVRQQGRHVAEAALAARASRLWDGLDAALGRPVDFVRSGILVLAHDEDDERRIVEGARESRSHGVESRVLTAAEVARQVPELAGRWRAGVLTEHDGHVEPARATRAFADAARGLGVAIEERCLVERIETAGGRIAGVHAGGRAFQAPVVVCAAGIGTAPLCRTLGIALPVQVVRACVSDTAPTPARVRMPVWTPHVAFRPRTDGSFVVGNGYREVDAEHDLVPDSFRHLRLFLPTLAANRGVIRLHVGAESWDGVRRALRRGGALRAMPEPRANPRLVAYNMRRFAELLPGLDGAVLARSWAGRIDATPDLVPVIGRVGPPQGLVVAAGFNGHGLALGPVVGEQLAQLVLDGRTSIDLRALRPERFEQGEVLRREGAL